MEDENILLRKWCGWCKRPYYVIQTEIELFNCPYCDAQDVLDTNNVDEDLDKCGIVERQFETLESGLMKCKFCGTTVEDLNEACVHLESCF